MRRNIAKEGFQLNFPLLEEECTSVSDMAWSKAYNVRGLEL